MLKQVQHDVKIQRDCPPTEGHRPPAPACQAVSSAYSPDPRIRSLLTSLAYLPSSARRCGRAGMISGLKIAVVLPAYNAAKTLRQTVADIPHDVVDDIILTDDCSTD